MNLTIRKARESDRSQFDWQTYRIGLQTFKPWVVAVDGIIFVAFGADREIVYQNGTESVAPLVRVAIRYFDSMQQVRDDVSDARQNKRSAETRRRYQEAMQNAAKRSA